MRLYPAAPSGLPASNWFTRRWINKTGPRAQTFTNYEAVAVGLWLAVAAVAWATADRWNLHPAPFRYLALAASVMIVFWLPGMLRV